MKQLTDGGHAISRIANLELDQLQALVAELANNPGATTEAPKSVVRLTNRVLVVGEGLAGVLDQSEGIDLVPGSLTLNEALHKGSLPATDLILVEAESFFPETKDQILELVRRSGAARALVVYRFSPDREAARLLGESDPITLLRKPVDAARLKRECQLLLRVMKPELPGTLPLDSDTLPERLFDAGSLAKVSRMDSAVNCECPRHLAELLGALGSFEEYSAACEDRNEEDAMVHAMLHRTTARARRSLEEALDHLMKAEGIELD